MTFIKKDDGVYLRLDEVVQASPESSQVMLLKMSDGTLHKVRTPIWEDALWSSRDKVVPAEPGTYMLCYGWTAEGKLWGARQAVLAWSIRPSGMVDPVTSLGIPKSETDCPAYLFPDGRVEDALGLFESYDQWFKYAVSQHETACKERG